MGAKVGGGGGGKYDLGQNSEINVTPFVDVMLVLLIIFMVSAPLATVSIKVDLPPATPPPPDAPKPKDPVYISLRANGTINLSGKQETDISRLIYDLSAQLAAFNPNIAPPEQVTLIRADREVLYEDFMEVVNTLQQNGFYKVGLISEELG
jgi:biopolymer transport protein ExbD